jgi:hypothetical protein
MSEGSSLTISAEVLLNLGNRTVVELIYGQGQYIEPCTSDYHQGKVLVGWDETD